MTTRKSKQSERFNFRWGIPALDKATEGGTEVPGFILRRYHQLGVSPAEMMLVVHLSAFHYNSAKGESRPSLKTISAMMGYKDDESVRRMVKELEAKGLLEVDRPAGHCSTYDFQAFSQRCLELDQDGGSGQPSDSDRVPDDSRRVVSDSDRRGVSDSDRTEDIEDKTENTRDSAPLRGGANARVSKKPKAEPKPRPRNSGYDMLGVHYFGYELDSSSFAAMGARYGAHASWINGNEVHTSRRNEATGKSEPLVIPPPRISVTPDILRAVRNEFQQSGRLQYLPKDFLKFVEVVDAELKKRMVEPPKYGPADPKCTVCHGDGIHQLDVPPGHADYNKVLICKCRLLQEVSHEPATLTA